MSSTDVICWHFIQHKNSLKGRSNARKEIEIRVTGDLQEESVGAVWVPASHGSVVVEGTGVTEIALNWS